MCIRDRICLMAVLNRESGFILLSFWLIFNKEFKKLFQNGIEEFFTDFWNVDSDLEIYLSKLK